MRDPVQHFVDGGNQGQDREEISVISIGYLEIRPCVPLVGGIHPASGPRSADWAYMALMESRISLESDFSDEKQIYISTGLGRKRGEAAFLCLDDV